MVPQTIALFRSNYMRGRVRIRRIYEGGEGIKPILRRRNVRHKMSERMKEKVQNRQLVFFDIVFTKSQIAHILRPK